MNPIPEKTIERLSRYRSLLHDHLAKGNSNIFSYELAAMMNTTPAQIRQDIMNIGYSGSPRKGYLVRELIDCIGRVLDAEDGTKIVLVGAGSLGKVIMGYLKGNRPKLSIVAAFDIDPEKIDRVISGVRCYHINSAPQIISDTAAAVGIIAVPGDSTNEVKDILIKSGIKALINFTSTPIKAPPNIYVEEIDLTVLLEKVSYYAKFSGEHRKL